MGLKWFCLKGKGIGRIQWVEFCLNLMTNVSRLIKQGEWIRDSMDRIPFKLYKLGQGEIGKFKGIQKIEFPYINWVANMPKRIKKFEEFNWWNFYSIENQIDQNEVGNQRNSMGRIPV